MVSVGLSVSSRDGMYTVLTPGFDHCSLRHIGISTHISLNHQESCNGGYSSRLTIVYHYLQLFCLMVQMCLDILVLQGKGLLIERSISVSSRVAGSCSCMPSTYYPRSPCSFNSSDSLLCLFKRVGFWCWVSIRQQWRLWIRHLLWFWLWFFGRCCSISC